MRNSARHFSDVLPFSNIYTVAGLMLWGFLGTFVTVQLVADNGAVNYLYLLMLIQVLPFVVAFTRRQFTYISFILLFHLLTFSATKLIQFRQTAGLELVFPELVQAIKEQVYCTLLTAAAYFVVRRSLFSRSGVQEPHRSIPLWRWQVVLVAAYVVAAPVVLDFLPGWFYPIHFLCMTAAIIILFTCHCPGSERIVGVIRALTILSSFRYFLHSGMMTLLGTLVSYMFLASCLEKRYGRIAMLLMGVVFASAVQTVKGEYRRVIWSNTEVGTVERVALLTELLTNKYLGEGAESENPEEDKSEQLLIGFSRVGDDSLERVLSMTPSKVPYWNGETYASIPYMFIPRVLWPEKPGRDFWNKYGRLYGVLGEDDVATSVGVSYLAEGYMNFGYTGMYAVALFVGVLIALVEASTFHVLGSSYSFSFLVMMTPLLLPSNDLGSMLQSTWTVYMFMVMARFLLIRVARRDAYS